MEDDMAYKGGFKGIAVKSKKIKGLSVELTWDCSEGHSGDYDPTDPTDEPLLRFDVILVDGKNYKEIQDGSYCTNLKATDDRKLLTKAVKCILNEAESTIYLTEDKEVAYHGFKRIMEGLSWIKIENGKVV